uniref:TonB-dependent receptor n=1 Tax=mine drainage metagenome TaxID=410659 RepID=E6PED7_9ZZZZ
MPLHALLCCLISIHVRAASGAPLAETRIVLTDTTTRARMNARSDVAGNARMRVAKGRYFLAFAHAGYASTRIGPLRVTKDDRIEVALQPLDSAQLHVIATVRVNGAEQPVRTATPHISISRAEMERAGESQVIGALESIPSITIARPNGGSSTAYATVALRGPDPSETLVMLDGQLLNDGNTGDLDLSRFPIAAFSNVEISEGLGPFSREGSNTIGGAVNLISLHPTRAAHSAFSLSTGSFGRNEGWYNTTGTRGKLGYAAALDDQSEIGNANQSVTLCTGGYEAAQPQPCIGAQAQHLGSTILERSALVNLRYSINPESDLAFRVFSMGDTRDMSAADNTPALATQQGAGADFIGPGASTVAQNIRAYDLRARMPLGAGSLLADASASNNDLALHGGGISPYDLTHYDRRSTLNVSWELPRNSSDFAIGGYASGESFRATGVNGTLQQQIVSGFLRESDRVDARLRLQGGLYLTHYSSFGSSLDGRIGAALNLGPHDVVRAALGTGFRAPLLIERYLFPIADLPIDSNCVATGQGNPAEQPEHATEYELGYSHVGAPGDSYDVALYRTNLRNPIEIYYPLGASCPASVPPLTSYPINVGNVVYQGAEIRMHHRLGAFNLIARYGLNVAYPGPLPATVSNPTSGGSLVANQQFLNIPQQSGSLGIDWSRNGWHAVLDGYAQGNNNAYNQGPFALLNAAVGRTLSSGLDITLSATNLTNAIAGRYSLIGAGVPYRGIVGSNAGNPVYGPLPTNRYFAEPFGLRLIVTIRR